MHGYFYDNSYVYLVYEYAKKGSLFLHLKNHSKLEEKEAAKVRYI
jgi:serine/threonine protein kinase